MKRVFVVPSFFRLGFLPPVHRFAPPPATQPTRDSTNRGGSTSHHRGGGDQAAAANRAAAQPTTARAAKCAPKVAMADQEYIWVAANVAHPFYTEGKAGWDAAAKALGVKASLVGPVASDVQQQITIIEQAIAKPTTAGILVYAVDYNALEPVLVKAREHVFRSSTGTAISRTKQCATRLSARRTKRWDARRRTWLPKR